MDKQTQKKDDRFTASKRADVKSDSGVNVDEMLQALEGVSDEDLTKLVTNPQSIPVSMN